MNGVQKHLKCEINLPSKLMSHNSLIFSNLTSNYATSHGMGFRHNTCTNITKLQSWILINFDHFDLWPVKWSGYSLDNNNLLLTAHHHLEAIQICFCHVYLLAHKIICISSAEVMREERGRGAELRIFKAEMKVL